MSIKRTREDDTDVWTFSGLAVLVLLIVLFLAGFLAGWLAKGLPMI